MRLISGRQLLAAFLLVGGVVGFFAVDRLLPRKAREREAIQQDAKGRVVRRQTLDGRIARHDYDAAGRLTRVSYHAVGRFTGWAYPSGDDVRFSYDAAGNRIETKDASGTTKYTYDDQGRASSSTMPGGKTLSYEYDPWSRIHRIDYAGGERVEYAHDPFGQILCASTKRGAVRFDYGRANTTLRRLPNGVETVYEKSPTGLVTRIVHRRKNGALIAQFDYAYDGELRVQSATETTPRGARLTRYQYDRLGRLVRVEEQGAATTYTYDALGNRTTESTSRGTTRYQYDATGRLVSAGDARFTYDTAGNITARSGADAADYEYDREGRLIHVKRSGADVHYTYDGDGNRVARESGGDTMQFALHRFTAVPQVIADLDEDGHLIRQYVLTGSRNSQVGADGRTLYFLEDRMGSTRYVVDGNGNIVSHYDYTPFGVPRLVEGRDETRFLFGGEEWDDAAQLIYLRARYYAPALGRFLTVDPIDGDPSDPQSYNSYAYAGSDPINRSDPTGLQSSRYPPPPPPPPPPMTNTNYDIFRRNDTYHLPPQILPPPRSPYDWNRHNPWPFPPMTAGYDWRSSIPTMQMPPSYSSVDPWRNQFYTGMPSSGWYDVYTRYNTPHTDPRYTGGGSYLDLLKDPWPARFAAGGTIVCALCFPEGLAAFRAASTVIMLRDVLRDSYHGNYVGVAENFALTAIDEWLGMRISRAVVSEPAREFLFRRLDLATGIRDLGLTLWEPLQRNFNFDFRPQRRESEERFDLMSRFEPFIFGTRETRNIFLPPGGGGGGGGLFPAVGGVYLDQTAKVIGNLGEIKGAMYDEKSGRLILVGDRRTSLPPMRAEYLAAAMRAVYSDSPHEPGMTIDPDPRDPHAPLMQVIFFGNTENTRLGWVMFEADRVMKGYSIGRDNVTRAAVQSRIPGYRSVTTMELADPQPNQGLWSRFWLVPEPVTARVSKDGRAIELDPVHMRVKTETMRWAGNQLVSAGGIRDAHAEEFARHFTDHYGDYEKESAVYGELRQVTAAVALAKWMKESGIPIDRNFMRIVAKPHPTPSRTPAAYAEEAKTTSSGFGIETLRIFTFGGVEMTPSIQPERGKKGDSFKSAVADAWTDAQRSSKSTFTVRSEGHDLVAVALPDSNRPELGAVDLAETDLSAAAARFGGLPGLVRSYNSFHDEQTDFGRAWTLLLPRLEFESASPTREQHFLSVEGREDTSVLVQKFVLTNDYGIAPVRFDEPFIDQNLQRVGFRAKNSTLYRAIYPEKPDLYRLFFNNGNQALFHSTGKLLAYLTPDSKALYEYDGRGVLTAIRRTTPAGQDDVVVTSDDSGRITTMTAAGEVASFDYDPVGNLMHVRSPRGDVVYRYDARHLLTGVARNGVLVGEYRYDDVGRLASQNVRTAANGERVVEAREAGRIIRRHYDANLRLTKIEDPEQGSITFRREQGRTTMERELPGGAKARAVVDAKGRLTEVEDPRGIRTEMQYRADGLPIQMKVNGKTTASYRYDARNRLTAIVYPGGWGESFSYDDATRTMRYQRSAHCGIANAAIHYDESGDIASVDSSTLGRTDWSQSPGVVAVGHGGNTPAQAVGGGSSPDGSSQYIDYVREGRRWRTEMRGDRMILVSPGGAQTQLIYDKRGLLESVVDPMNGRTKFIYEKNRLAKIQLPGGYCREYRNGKSVPCGEGG